MKKKLIKANIKFAREMLGPEGTGFFIISIPLILLNKINLGVMLLLYAALKYNINWNHDNLKDRLKKIEKKLEKKK